jgi:hypothetical protein
MREPDFSCDRSHACADAFRHRSRSPAGDRQSRARRGRSVVRCSLLSRDRTVRAAGIIACPMPDIRAPCIVTRVLEVVCIEPPHRDNLASFIAVTRINRQAAKACVGKTTRTAKMANRENSARSALKLECSLVSGSEWRKKARKLRAFLPRKLDS